MELENFDFESAGEQDKHWLDQLRRDVYAELFDKTWGEWDEERHKRHFKSFWKEGHISIITMGGVRVGVLQLFDEMDVIELGEIQVHPDFQNRGIGTAVLKGVLSQALEQGKKVSLHLGLKNDGAHRLYKRFGFQETKRTETHIFMECSV